jgi:F-type H+-transporting ATPase subunit epsilon
MLNLTITTVEREVLHLTDAVKVTIPTIDGEITILPGHVSLMSALGLGEVLVTRESGDIQTFFVDGGVLQVDSDKVELLANMAEKADEIDEAKVEEAKRRAEKLLEEQPVDVDLANIAASLRRETARLNISRKTRGTSGPARN